MMALTAEQQAAAETLKAQDNELQRRQKLMLEQQTQKEQLQAMQRQRLDAEAAAKEKHASREQEAEAAWQEVAKMAAQLGAGQRRGYDNLNTAWHEVWASCLELSKAISLSVNPDYQFDAEGLEALAQFAVNVPFAVVGETANIAAHVVTLGNAGGDWNARGIDYYGQVKPLAVAAYDYLQKKLDASDAPPPPKPALQPLFEVDDDTIRLTDFLVTAIDAKDISENQKAAIKDALEKIVGAWLGEHNKKLDGSKHVVDDDNNPVPTAELVALLHHPEHGLNRYCAERGMPNIQPDPNFGLSPSPRLGI